jgi:hypothetical protein
VFDHWRDVEDVLLEEELLVAHLQVVLSQQQLHAHRSTEATQQRHSLQPIALSAALNGIAVDSNTRSVNGNREFTV